MNKSKKKQLAVKVSSLEGSLMRFREVWERIEQGEEAKTPVEILSFENAALLVKTLSPKRLELLQEVHLCGKTSIRQLAKRLARDYSNVHQDVRALSQLGVILQDKAGKYYVPWDAIVTEISLCQETTPRQHSHFRTVVDARACGM